MSYSFLLSLNYQNLCLNIQVNTKVNDKETNNIREPNWILKFAPLVKHMIIDSNTCDKLCQFKLNDMNCYVNCYIGFGVNFGT